MISRVIKVKVTLAFGFSWYPLTSLTETLIILDITRTKSNNCFNIYWRKNGSHVFASSLMTSKTKWANPQKSCTMVIHDMITHDLECPWHDYCIICTWMMSQVLILKFIICFWPIRKEIVSSQLQCIMTWITVNRILNGLLIGMCFLLWGLNTHSPKYCTVHPDEG